MRIKGVLKAISLVSLIIIIFNINTIYSQNIQIFVVKGPLRPDLSCYNNNYNPFYQDNPSQPIICPPLVSSPDIGFTCPCITTTNNPTYENHCFPAFILEPRTLAEYGPGQYAVRARDNCHDQNNYQGSAPWFSESYDSHLLEVVWQCGNLRCDPDENYLNCPADCVCNPDNICNGGNNINIVSGKSINVIPQYSPDAQSLGVPVTMLGSYTTSAIDGDPGTRWMSWRNYNLGDVKLVIDLHNTYTINGFKLSCNGAGYGNYGYVRFMDTSNNIIRTEDYVCNYTYETVKNNAFSINGINKIEIVPYVSTNIDGTPDLAQIGEFEAYSPSKQCGYWNNGCGITVNCGGCPGGGMCSSEGVCCAIQTCASLGKSCGTWSDGCGGTLNCNSPCPIGTSCDISSGTCNGKIYWANINNNQITSADVGDSVYMMMLNTGASPGTVANFTIKEETSGTDIIRSNPITGIVDSNKNVKAKWLITSNDYSLTTTHDNYKFTINLSNTLYKSNLGLSIKGNSNNKIPNAKIINPIIDSKNISGININFNAILSDEDDDLNAIWDFGDGNITTITNCLSGNNCNITHKYSTSGAKIITLTAKETDRGQEAKDYTRILIYSEGINVYAIISSPLPLENIINTRIIKFNGSNSYVSNCTLGSCPVSSCENIQGLYCYNLNKALIGIEYDLVFNWSFSDGVERLGSWNKSYDDYVAFNRYITTPLDNWVSLSIGYNKSSNIIWSNKVITNYKIMDSNPSCTKSSNSANWIFVDTATNQIITLDSTKPSTANPNGCLMNKVSDGSEHTCCPLNTPECELNLSSPNKLSCLSSTSSKKYCQDYSDSSQCSYAGSEVANNTMIAMDYFDCGKIEQNKTNPLCYIRRTCQCNWNSSIKTCGVKVTTYNYCGNGGSPPVIIGDCIFNNIEEVNQCDSTGVIIRKQEASWTGSGIAPDYCKTKEIQIACSEIMKLPFFSTINFIITILAIIIIYTLSDIYKLRPY